MHLCPQDLYKPDAARFKRSLSAVINFARFREEKLTAYAEMQDELESMSAEKLELEQQEQQLVW